MSIREHGGAVRYWRHKTGQRAVLCADNAVLVLRGGRWSGPGIGAGIAVGMIEADPLWEEDTRSAMSAAITRTNRDARRRDV